MEPKLAFISKQIHWSLLIRAAIFAVSWWYFPAWLFVIIAGLLYFIPPFESRKNIGMFAVFLGVAIATPSGVATAIIYGILWYYLLMIKNLLIIDRKSGRTIFAMALSFFLFREFFGIWDRGVTAGALGWAWIVAIAFGILLNSVIVARRGKELHAAAAAERRAVVGVASLLILEAVIAGLFLPVDFIYQSIIVFLVAALLLDMVPAYFFGELKSYRIRTTAMTISALLVIVLASARWGI